MRNGWPWKFVRYKQLLIHCTSRWRRNLTTYVAKQSHWRTLLRDYSPTSQPLWMCTGRLVTAATITTSSQHHLQWLSEISTVLCHFWHSWGHFGGSVDSKSFGWYWQKNKKITRIMHNYVQHDKTKQLNKRHKTSYPELVTSYDIRSVNEVGMFDRFQVTHAALSFTNITNHNAWSIKSSWSGVWVYKTPKNNKIHPM